MIDATSITLCDVPDTLAKPSMQIRELTKNDASEYRTLRLRALKEYPTVFSSSYEVERDWSLDRFADRLSEASGSRDSFMLGCFAGDKLVGSLGFFRYEGTKLLHIGRIVAVHIAAEQQGNGYGRAMVAAALERARRIPGLSIIQLTATTTNEHAKSLYASFGFEICGTTPRAMLVEGEYIDEHLMVLKLD